MHKYCMVTANTQNRTPDCVTKVQIGNTVLTVSGFFKQAGAETAVDKMMKVLEIENALRSDLDGPKGSG